VRLAVLLEPRYPPAAFGVGDHVRAVQHQDPEFVADPVGYVRVGGGQGNANVANLHHGVHRLELLAEEPLGARDVSGVPLHQSNLS
jgi:hypothetical protein